MTRFSRAFPDPDFEEKYNKRHKLGSGETIRLLFTMALLAIFFHGLHDMVEIVCWNRELIPTKIWRVFPVLAAVVLLFGIYLLLWKKTKINKRYSEILLLFFIAGGFAIAFFGMGSYDITNPSPNNSYWEGVNIQFYSFMVILILKQQSARILIVIANTSALIAWRTRNPGDAVNLIDTVGLTLLVVFIIIKSENCERDTFLRDYSKERNFMKILDTMPESVIVLDRNKHVVFANDCSQVIFHPNKVIERTAEARAKIFDEFCSRFKHLKLRELLSNSKVRFEPSKTIGEGASPMLDEKSKTPIRYELMKRETIKKEKKHHKFLNFFETKSRKTPLTLEAVIDYLLLHEKNFRASPIHINPLTRDTYFLSYEASLEMRYFEINITFNPIEYAASLLIVVRETTQNYQISMLKNQDKMRTLALASISHEFRTPLNGSLTMLQLAMRNPDVPPTVTKELLTPAHGSMKMLLSLVNDILDYSQINENKFKLFFVETDLRQTVLETISVVEMLATRKGIQILHSFPDNLPSFFSTDPNRLSQILLNLLSNAIKFTIEGHITVMLELDDICNNLIHIAVEDTGIGMKPEDLDRLFSNYTKIDLGENQHLNSAGCGLGLNIANKLAMALGRGERDHMKVESTYGEGSKFTFTIENKARDVTLLPDTIGSRRKLTPSKLEDKNNSFQNNSIMSHGFKESDYLVNDALDDSFRYSQKMNEANDESERQAYVYKLEPHKSDISMRASVTQRGPPSRTDRGGPSRNDREFVLRAQVETEAEPNVFVVDDDLFNVHSLQMLLSTYGIRCFPAYDGSQIVSIIEKRFVSKASTSSTGTNGMHSGLEKATVIFMDTNMPVMDGFEATKRITKLAKEVGKDVIVVGVSGYVDAEHQDMMLKAGANYVLTKPIQKGELEKILKKHSLTSSTL